MRMDLNYAIEIMDAIAENKQFGQPLALHLPETIVPRFESIGEARNNNHWNYYNEHCRLLEEAGLIECFIHQGAYMPRRLTWAGQEYLMSVQSPTVRAKALHMANEAGGVTLPILRDLAVSLVRGQLGI